MTILELHIYVRDEERGGRGKERERRGDTDRQIQRGGRERVRERVNRQRQTDRQTATDRQTNGDKERGEGGDADR